VPRPVIASVRPGTVVVGAAITSTPPAATCTPVPPDAVVGGGVVARVVVVGAAVVVVAVVVVVVTPDVVVVVAGTATSVYVADSATLVPAVATSPMPIWQGSVAGGTGTHFRLLFPIPDSRIVNAVAGSVPLVTVAKTMCPTCAAPSQSAVEMLLSAAPLESALPHCESATSPVNGWESAALRMPEPETLTLALGLTLLAGETVAVPVVADAAPPTTRPIPHTSSIVVPITQAARRRSITTRPPSPPQ
jgi:hypothetical protein